MTNLIGSWEGHRRSWRRNRESGNDLNTAPKSNILQNTVCNFYILGKGKEINLKGNLYEGTITSVLLKSQCQCRWLGSCQRLALVSGSEEGLETHSGQPSGNIAVGCWPLQGLEAPHPCFYGEANERRFYQRLSLVSTTQSDHIPYLSDGRWTASRNNSKEVRIS